MNGNPLLAFFPALMAFAAFSDLFTFQIPNRVSLLLAFGYLIAAISFDFPPQTIGLDFLCSFSMLIITLTLFSFDMIGGGDAKLATATALWLGWANLPSYGLLVSIAGGALTLLIVAMRFYDLPKWLLSVGVVARLADKSNGVPYGIALAMGGLLVYPQTAIWARLAGV